MTEGKDTHSNFKELVLVPLGMLKQIQDDQKYILQVVQNIKLPSVPEGTIAQKFIPESKAKEMLGKGTTWFYNQRKAKKLVAKKMGGTNYYTLSDIELLFGQTVQA